MGLLITKRLVLIREFLAGADQLVNTGFQRPQADFVCCSICLLRVFRCQWVAPINCGYAASGRLTIGGWPERVNGRGAAASLLGARDMGDSIAPAADDAAI